MHLCVQKKRLNFERGQFVHPEQVYAKAVATSLWPKRPVFLEWREGCVEEIRNHHELRLASRLVSEYHMDHIDPSNLRVLQETEAMEDKARAHMEALPSDDEGDGTMHSDDDITTEDFMAWGCKRIGND